MHPQTNAYLTAECTASIEPQEVALAAAIERGTQSWAGTDANWLEDLRGGADDAASI
jgi:hypothetical protein